MMKTTPTRTWFCLAGAGAVLVLATGCTTRTPSQGPSPTPTPSPAVVLDAQPGSPDPYTPLAVPSPAAAPKQVPSPSLPAGQDGMARGQIDPATVDRANPAAVATAFAATLVAVDTKIDNRPNDAAKRAATYATADLSTAMTASAPISAPGAEWTTLQSHQGWTRVTTSSPAAPPAHADTPTEAWRAVTTVVTPTGADGWVGSATKLTWTAKLTRTSPSGPWKVAQFEETTR